MKCRLHALRSDLHEIRGPYLNPPSQQRFHDLGSRCRTANHPSASRILHPRPNHAALGLMGGGSSIPACSDQSPYARLARLLQTIDDETLTA